jgi:16S rRNA (guanine527-N7)-methyltransferase
MSLPENVETGGARERLNQLLREAGLLPLDEETAHQFEVYLSLILRWNSRTNLTAVRDAEGILARHFVESIACARALPAEISTLLDFGSGAGFPGLPIALCRPEIAVTLAESQSKKAAFLREAARTLGVPVTIHSARAEALRAVFDCVVLRAVDRMPEAIAAAAQLIAPGGWLAPMTTRTDAAALQQSAGPGFDWSAVIPLPGSEQRVLFLGQKLVSFL